MGMSIGSNGNLLEIRRKEEIFETATSESIVVVMRRKRSEWFGHANVRYGKENNRPLPMDGKRRRGRHWLQWKITVRRDIKAWKIWEEWDTDRG